MNKKKYLIKSLIIIISIIFLIYQEIYGDFSYFDELLAIAAWIYIGIMFICNKIKIEYGKLLLGLVAVIVLGIISNYVYGHVESLKIILVDIITVTKLFIIFIFFKYSINYEIKRIITKFMLPIAKIYSIVAFICASISLFLPLGMAGEKRFGIPSFHFIFPMQHQFTAVSIFVMCILLISNNKYKKAYIFINCFSIFLTTKGPAIIFCILFIFFIMFFKYYKSIKIWQWILIGVITLVLGKYQIETYLLNPNSPRALFFNYGIDIANENFPLGSGFATYGSPMAAKNYSQLYYKYGFYNLHGMGRENGEFLYDVGLASILGQLGWIGILIYMDILYKILKIATKGTSGINKAFIYAALIQFYIHSLGAAIISSSAAVIAIIGISMLNNKEELKEYSINKRGECYGKNQKCY